MYPALVGLRGADAALAYALPAGLYCLIRLWHITAPCVWADEELTLNLVKQDWGGMMYYTVADVVHPPLFYVLLKVWVIAGGESEAWVRGLPALFACLALIPIYLLARDLGVSLYGRALAVLLMAFNPFLIHYAREIRMYSLLMLLSACSLWLFVRWTRGASAAPLLAANILLVYSHYFGWLTVGAEAAYVLLARRGLLRAFALHAAGVVLAFLPWAWLVAAQSKDLRLNLAWIPRPGLSALKMPYANFHGLLPFPGSNLVGFLPFAAPVLWLGWRAAKERDSRLLLPALVAFPPVLLVFALSLMLPNSLFVYRYFIFAAPLYLLLVATAAGRSRALAAALFGWMLLSWLLNPVGC